MSYWKKFKKKYMGDRAFYRHYLLLAVPMILQNAITNLVSFLDNIMVGQLGTEQMSGVAIVNQLIFVYNLAIFGAVSAASILVRSILATGITGGICIRFVLSFMRRCLCQDLPCCCCLRRDRI